MDLKMHVFRRRTLAAGVALLAVSLGPIPAPVAAAQEEAVDTGFSYTLPALPDTVPLLASRLESERQRAQFAYSEARAELAETMPEDSAMVAGFQHDQRWTVTGQTEALIGLGSETYSYTGGAHGNTAFDALVWDVETDRPIGVLGLFANRYLGLSIIDQPFCEGLREQQIERMGDISGDDFWGGCPPLNEVAIAPMGSDGGPFTSFRVRVPPYIAGPYAAGSFDVDVRVTSEILDALKPGYRDSFALPAE